MDHGGFTRFQSFLGLALVGELDALLEALASLVPAPQQESGYE
jgi:hypothetical protein